MSLKELQNAVSKEDPSIPQQAVKLLKTLKKSEILKLNAESGELASLSQGNKLRLLGALNKGFLLSQKTTKN